MNKLLKFILVCIICLGLATGIGLLIKTIIH